MKVSFESLVLGVDEEALYKVGPGPTEMAKREGICLLVMAAIKQNKTLKRRVASSK